MEVSEPLNTAWKKTCKVLLGNEVGDLIEFKDYLQRYTDPVEKRKSVLGGSPVTISSNRIQKISSVMSYSEMNDYEQKTSKTKLDINQIKDIDSIVQAMGEKTIYTGNIVLGASSFVEDSHRCVNTNYALGCQDVYDGKYVAFTTSIRKPEYSFGCCWGGEIQFCIKILDPYKMTRCMECFHINVASDLYYCASLEDCNNCMFTFNQRNKSYLIGNIPLTKERYNQIKTKLVSEIAQDFKKNKKVTSIIDIILGK